MLKWYTYADILRLTDVDLLKFAGIFFQKFKNMKFNLKYFLNLI